MRKSTVPTRTRDAKRASRGAKSKTATLTRRAERRAKYARQGRAA